MKLREKQIQAVSALPGPKRYEHFIKQVADREEVWGLYAEGWALAETSDGEPVFPLWPAKEYASRCATGAWHDYEPEPVPLADLVEKLLPMLEKDGLKAGVFPTPGDRGVPREPSGLASDLEEELLRYA